MKMQPFPVPGSCTSVLPGTCKLFILHVKVASAHQLGKSRQEMEDCIINPVLLLGHAGTPRLSNLFEVTLEVWRGRIS